MCSKCILNISQVSSLPNSIIIYGLVNRDIYSRKSYVKNSWNEPLSRKSSRKILNVQNTIPANNLMHRTVETTSAPRKRFQPTQMFEKKRVKGPYLLDSEKEESKLDVKKGSWCNNEANTLDVPPKPIFKIAQVIEKSRTGYIPVGPDTGYKSKSNQDAYMTIKSFCGVSDQYFLGVFDGHGYNGQKVSKFIKKRLPKNIKARVIDRSQSYIDRVSSRVHDNRIISAVKNRRIS